MVQYPSLSKDGRMLAYSSRLSGNGDVLLRARPQPRRDVDGDRWPCGWADQAPTAATRVPGRRAVVPQASDRMQCWGRTVRTEQPDERNSRGSPASPAPGRRPPDAILARPLSGDGKTVFAIDPNDPRNILAQPIDGSAPRPLTRFTDKEIADLNLSPDGMQIAITRVSRVSDVVLIKGLK